MTHPTTEPSSAWRKGILCVPLLAVGAAVCFGATVSLSNGHSARQATSCQWLPLSWTIWATAYGSVVCAVAAVVLHLAMVRRARRNGRDPAAVWQGRLSVFGLVLAVLAVVAGGIAVTLTHTQAAELAGKIDTHLCEG